MRSAATSEVVRQRLWALRRKGGTHGSLGSCQSALKRHDTWALGAVLPETAQLACTNAMFVEVGVEALLQALFILFDAHSSEQATGGCACTHGCEAFLALPERHMRFGCERFPAAIDPAGRGHQCSNGRADTAEKLTFWQPHNCTLVSGPAYGGG